MSTYLIVSAAFLTTGGQDRANYAMASYLARRGHRLHLVAHHLDERLLREGEVTWHRAPKPLGSTLLGEPFLQRIGTRVALQLRHEDLRIITNGGNCDLPADVNWVHYVHAAYQRQPRGAVRKLRYGIAHGGFVRNERRALHRARLIIANSQRTALDLVHDVKIARERIRVLYYGIDREQFHPPLASPLERAGPQVLFIGGLGDARKGLDTLVHAWRILCADQRFGGRLFILGRGAELRAWKRCITRSNLTGRIDFLGVRSDVPDVLRTCDLLVAPARYEPYGLGVHEALCCGIPAIVSAGAGVAERFPDDLRHLLADDPDDAHDLAQRIAAALAQSRAQDDAVARFSEELRARTWDEMAGEIEQLIESSRSPASRTELVRAT